MWRGRGQLQATPCPPLYARRRTIPITFQSPEPVAPQAAFAYGGAEIGQRNNSTLAGLYESGARNQIQANLGTAQLQMEGAIARSREETSRGNEQAALAEQGRQFDQSRIDRQAAQEFSYRHEAAQSQQRTELAAWLNNRALSDKEELHLRTMTNSVADISSNPDFSPEEKVAAIAKLRTGIDVYEMRQRKALADQESSRASQMDNQVRLTKQSEIKADQIEAEAKDQGIGTMRRFDPHTGTVNVLFKNNATGVWYNPDVTHASEGMGKGAKGTTRFGDESGTFSYKNAIPEAKAEAEAAFPIDKQPGPEGKGTVDANAGERAKYMQKVLERMKGEHDGPVAQSPGEKAAERESPVKALDGAIEEAQGRKDLLPVAKQQLVGAMTTLKKITEIYPDVRTAPPDVQQQVQAAVAIISKIPPPAKPGPERRGLSTPAGPPSGIQGSPPPQLQEPPSWWQRNVVQNIPDIPGI